MSDITLRYNEFKNLITQSLLNLTEEDIHLVLSLLDYRIKALLKILGNFNKASKENRMDYIGKSFTGIVKTLDVVFTEIRADIAPEDFQKIKDLSQVLVGEIIDRITEAVVYNNGDKK